MARWVLDVLFQANLLIDMYVLLVVFDTTDLLETILIEISKFKLVQGLTEDAFLGDFKRLTRVVSEARSAHQISRCRRFISIVVEAITVLSAIHNL